MTLDRRTIFKSLLGSGALAALVLPERWTRPVVRSVIVPAHAQASPATTTSTTTTTAPTTTAAPTTTPAPTTSNT